MKHKENKIVLNENAINKLNEFSYNISTLKQSFNLLQYFLLLKNKKRSKDDKEKSYKIIPLELLFQIPYRKSRKNYQCNNFLNSLKLCC